LLYGGGGASGSVVVVVVVVDINILLVVGVVVIIVVFVTAFSVKHICCYYDWQVGKMTKTTLTLMGW